MMKSKLVFATEYNGKLTFWGVYSKYQEDFFVNWKAESTQKNALGYINRICNAIWNHNRKGINTYTKKDFDKVINKISKQVRDTDGDATIKRITCIIHRVIQIGASHGECLNIFDEKFNSPVQTNGTHSNKRGGNVVKSLSIKQMILAHEMLSDHTQSGLRMCLWLIETKGMRNNECVAADFIDIKPMDGNPGKFEIWVYKSSVRNSNRRKGGGKSKHAVRILPLTDSEYQFLMERKNYILRRMNKMGVQDLSIIEGYPIGCTDEDFSVAFSSNEVSMAGRQFFDELRVEREFLMSMQEELKEAVKRTKEEAIPVEDDLTSYVFRRSYATRLHIMQFRREDIFWILGHSPIGYIHKKQDYRNTAFRLRIRNRMELMPLCGSYDLYHKVEIEANATFDFSRGGQYVINANVSAIHIHLEAQEPHDEIKITHTLSNQKIITHVNTIKTFHEVSSISEEEIDVIIKYHQRFAEEAANLAEMKKNLNQKNVTNNKQ